VTSGAIFRSCARLWSPRCWLAVLGLECLSSSITARAAGPELATRSHAEDFLIWRAPPGCGTAAAIRERVSELLGQRDLDPKHVQRVEGRVRQTRDGWALSLRLLDAFGERERELTSRYCDDLAEAAAVAITLAFETARSREAAAAAAGHANDDEATPAAEAAGDAAARSAAAGAVGVSDPAEPAPADASRSTSESAPEDGERNERGPRLAFGAELVVDGNALPVVATGASVLGELRWAELRVGAFAMWLPSADKSVGPGQRVDFSLLAAGARACYVLGQGLVDTALCTGLEAGQLSARGSGLVEAQSAHDLWLAPQLGLALSAEPSHGLRLHAHAEAVAPLLRQGYAINATEDVHHVSSVGVRAGIGFLFGW
jgi:hypothetical protein